MSRREQGGFTLIELLIAVTLLGLIMAALTSAMIVAFRTVDATKQTVTDSTGAQLLSAYLVSDAQSADKLTPSTSCDSSSGVVLELQWKDADSAIGTTTDVVYKTESDGEGNFRLTRTVYSVNTAAGTCAQSGIKTMVQDVSNDPAKTLATCSPSPCNNNAIQVGLHVTAFAQQQSGLYSPYSFDISGTRRTQ